MCRHGLDVVTGKSINADDVHWELSLCTDIVLLVLPVLEVAAMISALTDTRETLVTKCLTIVENGSKKEMHQIGG